MPGLLDQEFLKGLQEYVERNSCLNFIVCKSISHMSSNVSECPMPPYEIKNYIDNHRKPKFNQVLFELIDKKGTTDIDVYQKAGIDRRHFSKIRSKPNYRPGKNTVIAISMALKLNKKETDELLSVAGYSLSKNSTSDLVILYCIEKKVYDIDHVNIALSYFDLKPLTGSLE